MTDHAAQLAQLADTYRQASNALDEARQALSHGVRAAARDDMRQVDILKATNHVWTREQVRRVVAEPEPQRPKEPAMATTTQYGTWGNHNHWREVEASVAEFLGEFGADFDVAALTSAYQDAITDALPDGWVLRGDDFYGPYPPADGYTEVIAEAIESVDLGELAEKFDRSIEGDR